MRRPQKTRKATMHASSALDYFAALRDPLRAPPQMRSRRATATYASLHAASARSKINSAKCVTYSLTSPKGGFGTSWIEKSNRQACRLVCWYVFCRQAGKLKIPGLLAAVLF